MNAAQQAHAADRLIAYPIAAGLGYVACLWLMGTSFHLAAADARHVMRHCAVIPPVSHFLVKSQVNAEMGK